MIFPMLVHQVTVVAYICDIVTEFILTGFPLHFRNVKSHKLKQTIAKFMKNIYENLMPKIPINLLCYWSNSTIAFSGIKKTFKNMNYILIVGLQKFVNFLIHDIDITLLLSNPADIL